MRRVLLAASLVAAAAAGGCTGGCYKHAAPVSIVPATSCLTLFGGQSATDDGVCAVPQLGGQNGCADTLTLPPLNGATAPLIVAPGARVAYPVGDVSRPGLVVTTTGGTTTYAIDATLGTTALTITIPVH